MKNAVTRLRQEKSLFSSLELAPLVFEVSVHGLGPTLSNPILVPQIRNILSGAMDWYLLIAFLGMFILKRYVTEVHAFLR